MQDSHLTASKGVAGSAAIAARSSAIASETGLPSRQRDEGSALMRAQPAASPALSSASEGASGTGTSRFLLRKPTAFSTDPFSWPEYGLQYRLEQR